MAARNKNKVHSFLLELFAESDTSKSDLAKMLGKKPEQITRWLGSSGNLTLDTISQLVFALTGGKFIKIEVADDLSRGKSNHQTPDWIVKRNADQESIGSPLITFRTKPAKTTNIVTSSSEQSVPYASPRPTNIAEIHSSR